ncbi:MAG: ABC transporter ATP-binding protein [Planctomycetota bacterium]
MIELTSVSKRYDDVTALDDVTLTVARGETKVLLGTSGCGKSTILRIMIGLIEPTSGTVQIEGQEMGTEDWEPLRQRMGYVIQDGGLFPHLTARGNATLMATHLGWTDQRINERLGELTELTHLPMEAMARFPAELSGGQRQRVSLIRALMLDPDIMLMDEPLGALDPITRSELQDDLKSIFAKLNKTVVIVTHDIGEAAILGDDAILLRGGKIVQQGPIQELIRHPADPFVTEFINSQRNPIIDGEAVS